MLGIITAVISERDAVIDRMANVKKIKKFDIDFYDGEINGFKCILVMAGVGKVNAAFCTTLMINNFNPKKIINIGSAGALVQYVNIGDVIISEFLVQHDVDVTIFGDKKGSFNENDGVIYADKDFLNECKTVMSNVLDDDFNFYVGGIATGDQFYNCPEIKNNLYKEFGTLCDEMEGAAVARVCKRCNIPFIVIRSISDKPKTKKELSYYDYNVIASERCADFVSNLINVQ